MMGTISFLLLASHGTFVDTTPGHACRLLSPARLLNDSINFTKTRALSNETIPPRPVHGRAKGLHVSAAARPLQANLRLFHSVPFHFVFFFVFCHSTSVAPFQDRACVNEPTSSLCGGGAKLCLVDWVVRLISESRMYIIWTRIRENKPLFLPGGLGFFGGGRSNLSAVVHT